MIGLVLIVACGDDDARREPMVDFVLDRERTVGSLLVVERTFASDDCALVEGAVPQPGLRRLLLFDVMIVNRGTRDLVIGEPANPVPPFEASDFEFSPCHGHFHFHGFADYELRDGDRTVGAGHKQAFCFADFRQYDPVPSSGYNCEFQGISVGWADLYGRDLDGQWIDVTDVPPGSYTLMVTVNAERRIAEGNGTNGNVIQVPVEIPP